MKPTQENILRLIQENKPTKALLSVQKVELGAIDDLKKKLDKNILIGFLKMQDNQNMDLSLVVIFLI